MIVDGLRPDYVTPQHMPHLTRLRGEGFWSEDHHAVFPTVTRVNAASLVTGAYPRSHGLIGNSMYAPEVDEARVLSTAAVGDLDLLEEASAGRLLTVPTLAEILAEHGLSFFAASSGSSGSGSLLNFSGLGAGLVHPDVIRPDSLLPVVNYLIGPPPDPATPNLSWIRWSIDALLRLGLDRADADVLVLWITEPDGTAHAEGVGAPATLRALAAVDDEVGRLLAGLQERGLLEATNVFLASDHGFSTRTGQTEIAELLIAQGLKAEEDSRDVVVAGGAIHVNSDAPERAAQIVAALQETKWVGPIFTRAARPGEDKGWIPGTLSFASIFWDHDRSADILTTGNWTSAENGFGYRGMVMLPGVASHGTTSPFDIRATLLVSGPDLRRTVCDAPTSNIDIAPTVLTLLGIDVPMTMEGRVLREVIADGSHGCPSVARSQVSAEVRGTATYRVTLHVSEVEGRRYVDYTEVER